MAKSRLIVFIGVLVALTPLSGLPYPAKKYLEIIFGLVIVGLSVWTRIDKKITQKAKARARLRKPVSSDESVAGETESEKQDRLARRATDFYPKTGQPGRRVTDIKWNEPSSDTDEDSI